MYSSDESGSSGLRRTTSLSTGTRGGSRGGNTRQQRAFRRHKRFSFSTETLGTLPEYSPSRDPTRPRPLLLSEQNDDTANQVQAWANDVAVASPPPTYPGYEDGAPQEGEFGEAKDPVPLSPISASTPPRPRRVRRVRSSGRMNDRLDQLLERSVMALEASNALLQSSLTTHSSLAAVLADSSFDRSMDVQIRYLARRMGAEGTQENGLDKVLEEVVGLISSSGLEDAQHPAPSSSVENAAANGDIRSGAISSMGYDNDGLSRSLPAEDHMEQMRMQQLSSSPSSAKLRRNKPSAGSQQKRLRLSDGPRPRSPPPRPFTQAISVESPNRVGYEKNEAAETIVLPSTSGIRTAPQEIPLYDPLPSATTTISSGSNIYQPSSSSQPETPVTPSAYTMLSHIQSRSSSISRAASPEAFKTTFRNSPRISVKAMLPDPESPVPTRGRGMGDVRPGLSVGWKASDRPSSPFGTQRTWPQRSQSSESRNPYEDEETPRTPPTSSRMPSASMFDLHTTLDTPSKPPRLMLKPEADEVGFLPSTSYKVSLSLRKILAEAENQSSAPVSEVAKGKQRAEGERPDDMLPVSAGPRYTRSLDGRTSSPLMLLTAPSISPAAVVREDFSKHMSQHRPSASLGSLAPVIRDELGAGPSATGTLTPRRSALKGSSGRTTPLSSGQSSPRVVTFSPLPPKYASDGSVGRARAKSKTKAKEAKNAKEAEKGGWLTQWLLGSTGDSGTRTFTPVHSRTGSLLREEGRWHGGLESWQI